MSTFQPNDGRGALWRRWDLHFHTPASFDYRGSNVTNKLIVDTLVQKGTSVVAITDHHHIDVERIEELKSIGNGRLTILPGIELRSELGGSATVHYIGLFPETANVGELWTNLQGKLGITPSKVAEKGNDKFYVSYKEGCEAIHELGGIVSMHAGKKSNSIEEIKNKPPYKMQVKVDIVTEHVDILEVSSEQDRDDLYNIVFPNIKITRPVIVASDNHNISSYSSPPLWIRGDATFAALKHLKCEPKDRIHIGDMPALTQRVRNNPTRYIRGLEIRKVAGAQLSETWFDNHVPLNHGLVAIIGNKGSGKSALADIAGLLGDSQSSESFSFLNGNKFRKTSHNKAKHFNATITWESDGKHTKTLADDVAAKIESVKYLPQQYIENVCNELQEYGVGRFSKELESVIFSHVDVSDRLGCTTFDELLRYKTAEKEKSIGQRRAELRTAIENLVNWESWTSQSFIGSTNEQLAAKQRELDAHNASPPAVIAAPSESDSGRAETLSAEQQIQTIGSEIAELERQLLGARTEAAEANKRAAAADRLTTRLNTLESTVRQAQQESLEDCNVLGVTFNDVVKMTVNRAGIMAAKAQATESLGKLSAILNDQGPTGLAGQIQSRKKQIAEIQSRLAEPARLYQKYIEEMREWGRKRDAIVGTATTEGSLKYFQRLLETSANAAAQVSLALEAVITKTGEIHDEIGELAKTYSELYKPVQTFIDNHPLAKQQFQMAFEAKLVERQFTESFLGNVAQNKRGSFNGSTEGRERVTQFLRETDFQSKDSTCQFVRKMWDALHFDLRQDDKPATQVGDQLAKGSKPADVYSTVFNLGYISPFFTLKWAGKDVQQLSPGERGTLLLVFYLLIDRSDIPLIIDQPEENLDNQTVFNVLVPSIKEARGRRQVIIVTHNPNLAVVCDADQIIYAEISKEHGNRITYEMGSIENPVINRKLLDILEGTRPAFENRDAKYHPHV